MKKTFLLLTIAAVILASCSKNGDGVSPAGNSLGASAKAKPVQAPGGGGGAGGGGGNGGGGNGGGGVTPPPPTNLDIFTKQLTGQWLAVIGTNEPVPNIPNAFGTIFLRFTFNANGTYSYTSTDNVSGAQLSGSGTWKMAIPATLPINENGTLVLTGSNGATVLSGLFLFVRPGVLQYTTSVNTLDKTIRGSGGGYIMQKT